MIRFNLLLTLFFVSFSFAFAQIDVLQAPDEKEKAEILRITSEYEKYMTTSADSALAKEKKALATLKFSKEIQNNDVQVYNDLDSVSGKETFLKIFNYAQRLDESFSQSVRTVLVNPSLGKVKYDKIRRYHFVEVNADKKITWSRIQKKVVTNSELGKDSVVTDTAVYSLNSKITLYIRFEKTAALSKNFKLFAIAKQGSQPVLEPLPESVVWWLNMDPLWKGYFRERLKLEEYPTAYQIESIGSIQELDLGKAQMKHLQPLSRMPFLRKLILTNSQISDLTPLYGAKGLTYLNLTGSQVKSLTGVDSLYKLEELYCAKLQLTSIEPIRNLTSLIKLDISDNDLVDVSPLEKLVNLKELNLALNEELPSVEVIKNLSLMEKLNLSKIRLGNVDVLKGMVNLIELNLYNTNITSLEPIRGHQKIIYLNIDHNKITTLEPIKDFKFLLTLSFASTSVTDISQISNFPLLREVNMASNPQISSLGPVHKLEYIRELKCFYTKINKEEVARFKKNHPGCQITYW